MNTNTLISPAQAVALAFPDGEYITPDAVTESDIAAAERRHILPVIGAALHTSLLGGAHKEFSAEYLAPAVALAVRLAVQPRLDIRTERCGTVAPRSQTFQPAGDEAIGRLRRNLRIRMRDLLRRASDHLEAHATDFPEYDSDHNVLNRCTTDGGLVQIR